MSCGPYDPNLLKLWDEYDQENESENVNPSEFPSDQIYLTLHMQFGGTDLEHTSIVTNQKRIRSILFQVILSVAQGEEQCQLEHRDLHWGNILIENSPDLKTLEYDFKENRISIQGANVKVVLIDFTLARMKSNDDTVVFNNLDDIEGLFDGTGEDEEDGDIQFDIYRWMKATTMSDWKGFHPKTNVHWIHYLLQKLKTFDIPFMPAKNMDLFQNRLRTEYESVSAIVLREMVNKTGIFTKHAVIIE